MDWTLAIATTLMVVSLVGFGFVVLSGWQHTRT
jgi:hypothetical protein